MVDGYSPFRLATRILCEVVSDSSSFLTNSLTLLFLEVLIQVTQLLWWGGCIPQKSGFSWNRENVPSLSDWSPFPFLSDFLNLPLLPRPPIGESIVRPGYYPRCVPAQERSCKLWPVWGHPVSPRPASQHGQVPLLSLYLCACLWQSIQQIRNTRAGIIFSFSKWFFSTFILFIIFFFCREGKRVGR